MNYQEVSDVLLKEFFEMFDMLDEWYTNNPEPTPEDLENKNVILKIMTKIKDELDVIGMAMQIKQMQEMQRSNIVVPNAQPKMNIVSR